MSILTTVEAKASSVKVTNEDLIVMLVDGREIKVPLTWFPKLLHAKNLERGNYRLIGGGVGIHWPDIDEDLSIAGILAVR